MKSMLKDALILFLITLISGAVLGLVYQVTKEPIAEQEAKAKNEACKEVFESAAAFKEDSSFQADEAASFLAASDYDASIEEISDALDADGQLLGYVITVTDHEGYGGDIRFSMGITLDGTLNGISILQISETAGLGMKAEEVLKPQFKNKKADKFEYTKNGAAAENQIDAISGATITTNAVTNGVNAGLAYFQANLMQEGGSADE